jgi:hypothetical protein
VLPSGDSCPLPRLLHGEDAPTPVPRRSRARLSTLFSTAPPLSLSGAGSTSHLRRAVELAGPAPSAPPSLATRWRTTSCGAQPLNRAPWHGGGRHGGALRRRRRRGAEADCGGGHRAPLLVWVRRWGSSSPASSVAGGGAATRQWVPLRRRRWLQGRRQPPSPDLPPSLSSSERRHERGVCVCRTRANPGGGCRIPSDSKETGGGQENEGGYPVPTAAKKR